MSTPAPPPSATNPAAAGPSTSSSPTGSPGRSGRGVGLVATIGLVYRLVLRQLATRGRLIALVAVGAAVVAIAAAVGAADTGTSPTQNSVELVAGLGFTILVPIVALVFGSAGLGELREDRTLIYLWLRPLDRWPIVVGSWLAALTISLPITLVPLVLAALVGGGTGEVIGATLVAAVVGVIAYSAVFSLVGLVLRNAIVWGIGYVLIWEGIGASFGDFAAKLAISGYTRSILSNLTDVTLELGELPLGTAVAVPLVAGVVALGLAAVRLARMDID